MRADPTTPVLVTGAGGFLGTAVVRALHADGQPVRAHLGPPGTPAPAFPAGVATATAEVTDAEAMAGLSRGCRAVVHLAGPPSVAASFADPVGCVRSHVLGTAVVLAAAAGAGVGRLVHVSSAEVYGTVEGGPVPESARTSPRSPYGAAKLGAEALVRAWPADDHLERVVLRPFSVYGPGAPVSSLVGTVLRAAATADVVEVRSLDTVRDYVHVDDVASAVLAALAHPEVAATPVFNVGTGVGTSVAGLVREALLAAGRDVPLRVTGERDRPGRADLTALVADVRETVATLGWRPRLSLRDGLAASLRALR